MSLSMLNDKVTFGVIGTAGRGLDNKKLNKDVYDRMYLILQEILDYTPAYLISGGAAWADHLAVRLHLNSEIEYDLKLELPCGFINGAFDPTACHNGMMTGAISNLYHQRFSSVVDIDSLGELKEAINSPLCRVDYAKGFFDRNLQIAKADKLIAFTYGNGAKLKDGGTAHTAKQYIANGGKHLYHVDLNDFRIYENATA